jgi:hypothetical protein
MPHPVYVLENGERVPYVPIEIKDHREAYAATLHVLFKHVADFHICVVKSFSKKYGIPEDDIMQTIQESEEFKNMQVDPVLHYDGLGYITQEPAVVQPEPAVVQPEPAVVAKKRIVRKKAQVTPTSEKVISVPKELPITPQIPEAPPSTIEKKKIIRKKLQVAATTVSATELEAATELDRNDDAKTHEHTLLPATPSAPVLHSDALVQLLSKDTTSSAQPRKKIIRKKS